MTTTKESKETLVCSDDCSLEKGTTPRSDAFPSVAEGSVEVEGEDGAPPRGEAEASLGRRREGVPRRSCGAEEERATEKGIIPANVSEKVVASRVAGGAGADPTACNHVMSSSDCR